MTPSHDASTQLLRYLLWPTGDDGPVRQKGCRRKTAPSAWRSDLFAGEAIMKCDICNEHVENSEELQKHMEAAHPAGVGDNLERPDLLGDTPEESAAVEAPLPTH
jgi:hypothetical protein